MNKILIESWIAFIETTDTKWDWVREPIVGQGAEYTPHIRLLNPGWLITSDFICKQAFVSAYGRLTDNELTRIVAAEGLPSPYDELCDTQIFVFGPPPAGESLEDIYYTVGKRWQRNPVYYGWGASPGYEFGPYMPVCDSDGLFMVENPYESRPDIDEERTLEAYRRARKVWNSGKWMRIIK